MRRPRRPVANRVALVTGAARGLGEATARLLAARGATVALVGLEAERLAAVAASIGGTATPIEADVRDRRALDAAVAAVVDRHGRLDVVVANAGVEYAGASADLSDAEVDATVDVNLRGVLTTVRATLPQVRATGGQYLLVSSLAAMVQLPLLAEYAASKAAVHAYGNALRLELAEDGVAVTVAYLGFVDTALGRLNTESGAIGVLRTASGGALSRLWPVDAAATAIVDGIEARARRVVYPRAVGGTVLLPALAQALTERAIRGRIAEALRRARDELTPDRRGSMPALAVGSAPQGAAPRDPGTPGGGGTAAVADGLTASADARAPS